MAKNPTENVLDRRADQPTYRVAPGGQAPDQWTVVPISDGPDAQASVSGFETLAAAEKDCDRLNALWAAWKPDDGTRDEVLGRMLNTSVRAFSNVARNAAQLGFTPTGL